MAQLYDEEGNLIDGALTPDEVLAIKEEKEAIAREAAEIKERLIKLESKDMNFRRLEQMTEEEKSKLSAQEIELKKQIEDLSEKQREFADTQINAYKNSVLSSLTDDEETKAKVLKNYDRIKDDAKSPDEIQLKMREAFSMTVGTASIANPLNVAMGYSGGQPPKKQSSNFAESDRGKALAASLGMKTDTK